MPARTKVTSMDLLVKMTEHHEWLVGQMIDRAARLSDDQLDAALESPMEDDLTLRSVLSRLVGQMAMWNAAIATRPYDWSLDALGEPVQIFTYGGLIAHVITFAAYRRTLVAGAFERYGVGDLGWGDPMRWVAEPVG